MVFHVVFVMFNNILQWRIQVFPYGVAPTSWGRIANSRHAYFLKNLRVETKELGHLGWVRTSFTAPPLDPPMQWTTLKPSNTLHFDVDPEISLK